MSITKDNFDIQNCKSVYKKFRIECSQNWRLACEVYNTKTELKLVYTEPHFMLLKKKKIYA